VGRITIVVSLLLHVVLALAATHVQEEKRKRRATAVAVVNEKKKEAKPEDKPKPPPPAPRPAVAPKAAPEPKAEAAPAPAPVANPASSEASEPLSAGSMSSDGPGLDVGGPARDASAGRKDAAQAEKPKAVKPVVKKEAGEGGAKGEEACTEEPSKPEAISKVEIEYTDSARADGVEGVLKLRVTVGAQGEVSNVEVISSVQASLDAAAIATVKQWRFKPAMRCGKPFAGGTFVILRKFELGD
jgi:protein TonB